MASTPIRLLLIEDELDFARALQERLSKGIEQPFCVDWADRLETGLERLAKDGADLILLDLTLPDSHGLDTFIRTRLHAPETPVVVLTASDEDAMALEAVRNGAQDFLIKGQGDAKFLVRTIRYAIERHRLQVTLRRLVLFDDLTGLYNRRGFFTLAQQHLKLARRSRRGSWVMFADLDGLKQINDTFGHQAGDLALVKVAEILRQTFRSSDVIGRVGGDEFPILAIEAKPDSVQILVGRLQERLDEFNRHSHLQYGLSLSVGTARLDPEATNSVEEVVAKADEAMYERKRSKASHLPVRRAESGNGH